MRNRVCECPVPSNGGEVCKGDEVNGDGNCDPENGSGSGNGGGSGSGSGSGAGPEDQER